MMLSIRLLVCFFHSSVASATLQQPHRVSHMYPPTVKKLSIQIYGYSGGLYIMLSLLSDICFYDAWCVMDVRTTNLAEGNAQRKLKSVWPRGWKTWKCQGIWQLSQTILKVREVFGKNLVKEKWFKTVYCELHICIHSWLCWVCAFPFGFGWCTVAFLPPPLTITLVPAWYE